MRRQLHPPTCGSVEGHGGRSIYTGGEREGGHSNWPHTAPKRLRQPIATGERCRYFYRDRQLAGCRDPPERTCRKTGRQGELFAPLDPTVGLRCTLTHLLFGLRESSTSTPKMFATNGGVGHTYLPCTDAEGSVH